MTSTNGPLSMYQYNMNLTGDVNYIEATNPLHVRWDSMKFYEHGLIINRTKLSLI